MRKFFRLGPRIGLYVLAFTLPIVTLAGIVFYSTLQLTAPQPAALVLPAPVFYPHADQPDRFAFDEPLWDLARQENIPTTVLAAKRLEYRPGTIQSDGAGWPMGWPLFPLLVGAASLAGTWDIRPRWRRRAWVRAGGGAAQAHT